MATVNLFPNSPSGGFEYDDVPAGYFGPNQTGGASTPAASGSSGGKPPGASGSSGGKPPGLYDQQTTDPDAPGYSPHPAFDEEAERQRLKKQAEQYGLEYDESDLADIARMYYNTGPNGGMGGNLAAARAMAERKYRERSTNTPGGGGGGNGGGGGSSSNLPGGQFDDAYSSMLENIAKSQMGEVRSNPALDQLMAFLSERFADLSTNPGYSPEEMAMLNTQAFEPIEALRRQAQQNELQRTARAGYLPTSGLTRQNQMDLDRAYDQMRTVANRDLAINAIGKRNADLNQALDIGQLRALAIPAAQRGEELALGNLLYQMPRTAMFDALSVINGSPSSNDAFMQALQLAQQAQQAQQFNQQNNSALMGQIGYLLANLMGGR